MKRRIFYIFTSLVMMFLLTSCVKDRLLLLPEDDPEYFNPDEWKLGTMIVNTDWSRTDQGVPPADDYYLTLNENTYIVGGVTNVFRHLHPETYRVFAFYDPQGIHIEDNVATVDSENDGTLLRNPGTLMVSNFEEAKVMRSDTTYVNLIMRQLVHEVTVNIYMWPGDEQFISNITTASSPYPSHLPIPLIMVRMKNCRGSLYPPTPAPSASSTSFTPPPNPWSCTSPITMVRRLL